MPKALVHGSNCLHGRCFAVDVPKADLVFYQGLKESPEGEVKLELILHLSEVDLAGLREEGPPDLLSLTRV